MDAQSKAFSASPEARHKAWQRQQERLAASRLDRIERLIGKTIADPDGVWMGLFFEALERVDDDDVAEAFRERMRVGLFGESIIER